jgi:RNA polymerase sigma factor (sigma-70 family)
MDRKERCETCRWCRDGWQCRRLPPRCFGRKEDDKSPDYGWYPTVYPDGWCGEWQPTSPAAAQLDTIPADAESLRKDVQQVLAKLTWREREIVKLRYGLDNGHRYTLEECGHIFKVTRERIRTIEKKAVAKLAAMPDAEETLKRCSEWAKQNPAAD